MKWTILVEMNTYPVPSTQYQLILEHFSYNPGLDWMGSDQGCDTLGSDDIEEDIKVVPEIVLDQFSPDCSEIKNEEELLDQSVSGNYYIFSFYSWMEKMML